MSTGEYVYELRTDPLTEEWRPSLDVDPVPDNGDQETEMAAERLRQLAARDNRRMGFYKYRTRYVPAAELGDAYTDAWSPGGR